MALKSFPNPATDKASLELNLKTPGRYDLQISDNTGRMEKTRRFS